MPRSRLLDVLPDAEQAYLAAHLQSVRVRRGEVLLRAGTPIHYVYFPQDAVAVISLDGENDVVAIGTDGAVGISVVFGGAVADTDATVRVPGRALRISVAALLSAAAELPSLRALLERSWRASLMQMAHAAVCGRAHQIEQRLAGLLLWLRDQSGSDRLPLTHEHLARLLGTNRRATVTEAALALRGRGVLRPGHGNITIASPVGLREAACGCYSRVREYFDGITEATRLPS